MRRGTFALVLVVLSACAPPDAASRGVIEIHATEGIGEVYVDARPQGSAREVQRVYVPAGTHVVELRRDHLVIASDTIEVRGGDALAVDLDRAAIGAWAGDAAVPAQLELRTTPVPASAVVDGVVRGITPVQLVVAPGTHRVALAAEGYDVHEEDVVLAPGSTAMLEVTLVP